MKRIYARNTKVEEISLTDAAHFIDDNHSQGWSEPGKNFYALSLNDGGILAVATFSNPRTAEKQRQYSTELHRLCFKKNHCIIGGASKLIQNFIHVKDPDDLFTYQDTSGESTDVYEKCGMTLIGDPHPTKKVLVKNGLSFDTATNNREDWFSMEQMVRLGPDKLVGSDLGERFKPDGKRYSNIELCEQFLGYHVETIPGDRVYAWHNPNRVFYVYEITSTIDNAYYFGRHKDTIRDARNQGNLVPLLVKDKYFGSGGEKFKNWVATVDNNGGTLIKSIVAIFFTRAEAIDFEKKLIGDKYKTDPNCKNSMPGGVGHSSIATRAEYENCPIHGRSKHRSHRCLKCLYGESITTKTCPTHGETKFQGNRCCQCRNENTTTVKECPIHGRTTFQGGSCCQCSVNRVVSTKKCPVHGTTLFRGNTCSKCGFEGVITKKECPVHGVVAFRGDTCITCTVNTMYHQGVCDIHGETTFQSGTCCKCMNATRFSFKECLIHGVTKFAGQKCCACMAMKTAHTRWHKNKKNPKCHICSSEMSF